MRYSLREAFRNGKPSIKRWWDILVDFDNRITALENANSSQETTEDSQPVTRNISFSILDNAEGNAPIGGASVVIGEVTKTTGSAGGCTFNDISDGAHSVEVSADGYVTKTESITVSSEDTSFTINLTANE